VKIRVSLTRRSYYPRYNYTKPLRNIVKRNSITAFQLHQATVRYYHTILLAFTGYKPKTHDIEELGLQAKNLDAEFAKVFLNNTKEEKHLFDLLQKAYIDARYKPEYSINLSST
jgi:uncharacterized protein